MYFLNCTGSYITRALSGFRWFHELNLDFVSARHTLELDEIVVRAVGGEEGTCVLEILHLGLALQRLLARLVVPVREEDGHGAASRR